MLNGHRGPRKEVSKTTPTINNIGRRMANFGLRKTPRNSDSLTRSFTM